MKNLYTTMDRAWIQTLETVINFGQRIAPRGKITSELLHHTNVVDMRYPVLTHPDRKLNYQFMAAEAFWILSGDDRVSGIAPYNKHIAQFSDDGTRFFGAYGPKIMTQLPYMISTLRVDPDSRQAGLTIWRENPPQTKDVPCTISIFANIRHDCVNLHVFMRSSDVWLGLPYDVFNFSMLGHLICARLNDGRDPNKDRTITPGILFLTAMSTHLYHTDLEKAQAVDLKYRSNKDRTPTQLYLSDLWIFNTLRALRESVKGHELRWWEFDKEEEVHDAAANIQ